MHRRRRRSALITIANLRGLREAGNIFAVPTYLFLGQRAADDRHGRLPDRRPRRDADATAGGRSAAVRTRPRRSAILAAPAGVRVRRRGPDRHRGDRDRRAGVQAARGEERRDDARGHGRSSSASCSSASRSWPSTSAIVPIEEPGKQTVIAQVAATVFGDDSIGFYLFQAFTALLLFLAANTSLRRLPAPRRGPRRGRLLPAPVRVPRRPAGVLDGHHRARRRRRLARRRSSAARPTPSSRSTRSACSSTSRSARPGMIRHWLRDAVAGLAAAPGDQRRRLRRDRRSWRSSSPRVKFVDGAWLVLLLIPILVAMMLFIRRQYDAQETELQVRDDLVARGAAPRAARRRPGQRHQPGGRPGGELRADDEPRRPGGLRHRRPRGRRGAARALGAPAPGRAAGHRRVAVPGGHLAGRRLPRRPRPGLAAGQGGADHDRRPARVRAPATGGTGCSTTRRRSASRRRSSGASTRSSPTSRTGAEH